MHMDPKFNCIGRLIIGTELNTTATRDHLPEIERQIQVEKEKMQELHGGLPHDCMTRRMITELRNYVVMMIYTFPPKSGIS